MNALRLPAIFTTILLCALLLACSGGDPELESNFQPSGDVLFSLDLSPLQNPTESPAAQSLESSMQITAVQVSVSRGGYPTTETDLAVEDNIATGRIDNLAAGYWHVLALVYSGEALIYQGEADVNIIAGAEVVCRILFDPVIVEPTTGSMELTVGLNPMPGYRAVNQAVSHILLDEINGRFYILDASASLIGVYHAETLNRIEDIALPQAPQAMALDAVPGVIFMGYPSGQIYTLNTNTKKMALLGDVLGEVQAILPVGPNFLFIAIKGNNYNMDVKSMDRHSGQVVAIRNTWYSMTSFVHNPQNGNVYAHYTGVSPTDIHRFSLDLTSGAIVDNGDSIYHGDHSMGPPLRLIRNGTRLTTASGNIFTSAGIKSEDLLYAGNLGHAYLDLISDDVEEYLYLLNRDGIRKLLVLDPSTYFTIRTVELEGNPKRVFATPERIIVFAEKDGFWYARAISKASLDL
jgi:hypothetical protein